MRAGLSYALICAEKRCRGGRLQRDLPEREKRSPSLAVPGASLYLMERSRLRRLLPSHEIESASSWVIAVALRATRGAFRSSNPESVNSLSCAGNRSGRLQWNFTSRSSLSFAQVEVRMQSKYAFRNIDLQFMAKGTNPRKVNLSSHC